MTTRLSRLNELSAELDGVMEFAVNIGAALGRNYGKNSALHKQVTKDLKKIAVVTGVSAGAAGAGGAYLANRGKRKELSSRHENLLELSSELSNVIEFGRYDDETGDNRMLKDAAGVAAVGGGGLAGGLYLRNRGDAVNAAKYAELQKAPALAAGMEGPKIASSLAEHSGGNWNAIKTGGKDVLGGLKDKLKNFKWSRALPAVVKASAKHERLLELSAELDGVVELGLKYGDKVGEMLKISGAKRANALGESTRKRMYINVGPQGSAWNTKDKGFNSMVTGILNNPDVKRVKGGMAYTLPPRRKMAFSSRHENLIALSSELDKVINLDIEDGIAGGATVAGTGLGLYGLHQRGLGVKLKKKEVAGIGRNISAGAKDLFKSGKSYLRAALK